MIKYLALFLSLSASALYSATDNLTDEEVLFYCETQASLAEGVMQKRQMGETVSSIRRAYKFKEGSNWVAVREGFIQEVLDHPVADTWKLKDLTVSAYKAAKYAACLRDMKDLQEYVNN